MYVILRYDLELGFQGEISKTPYVVIPTMILTLDRPWPWTRIVKLKFSKSSATGGPLDIEWKAYESDTMLDPLCQLELWPQQLLDSEYLDFHDKILKWLYLWNGWTDGYETREYKSLDLTYDLDLGFPRLNFWNNYIRGITWDITSVHGKHLLLFICYIRWW